MSHRLTRIAILLLGPSWVWSPDAAAQPGAPLAEPPAGEPPAGESPAGEPADEEPLPDLDAETGAPSIDRPRTLRIYGFADFTFRRLFIPTDSAWQARLNREASFSLGNLNLYLRSEPAPRWSSLAEVRFTFLPNGAMEQVSPGVFEHESTDVPDNADLGSEIDWGGVVIERAWVQYDAHPLLSIRAGHWLTPYGLWNIDHGTPTVIGVRRPFIVSQELFPESQSGLQLLGATDLGNQRLRYHLTVSNGRGDHAAVLDSDDAKSIGSRLELDTELLDQLRVGVSTYAGYFSRRRLVVTAEDPSDPSTATADHEYLEEGRDAAVAADVRVRWGRLGFDGEIIARQILYSDRGRPPHWFYGGDTREPDSLRWGWYGLLSYQKGPWNLLPYTGVERMHDGVIKLAVWAVTAGINARPVPQVVLKLGYSHAVFSADGGVPLVPLDPLRALEAQVAWVF